MKNLVKLYNKLTDTEIDHGKRWYEAASEYCRFLSERYGVSHSSICGIVAALSPACSWERNKQEAEWLLQSNLDGYKIEPFQFTTYGPNVIKAQRIYAEGSGTLFNPKTGAKTYNFWRNLCAPNDVDAVTIDRHAVYAATGEYRSTSLTYRQYEEIASHYKKAAAKVGLIPCQFQAAIWVGVKNGVI